MELYGRLEGFFSDSRKVLTLSIILGIIFSLLMIFFSASVYRDSVEYSAMAQDFALGNWTRFFEGRIPPLFPLLAGILCKAGMPVYYASMTVGCVFNVLTIFPLYGFLKFFINKKYSAWGTLFFILAPKIIRFGFISQLESGKFFFLTLGIYLVFSFCNVKKWWKLLLLGLSSACLALYRSEGIIYLPILLVAMYLLILKEFNYKINFKYMKTIILHSVLAVLFTFAFLSPRIFQVYQQTGFPSLDARGAYASQIIINKVFGVKKEIVIPNKYKSDMAQDPVSGESYNFSWVFSSKQFSKFIQTFSKGSYELYLVFAVLGFILMIRGKKWNIDHSIMIWFVVSGVVFYYVFTSVATRYFLVNIIFFMPFILEGFRWVIGFVYNFKLKIIFTVLLFFLSFMQMINGLDNVIGNDEISYKQLGKWIYKNRNEIHKYDNNRPLSILLFGEDYGLALWSGADTLRYSLIKFSYGESNISDVINKGVPSCQYSFLFQNVSPSTIIRPVLIVFFEPDKFEKEIKVVKSLDNIKQIKTKWDQEVLVFLNNTK